MDDVTMTEVVPENTSSPPPIIFPITIPSLFPNDDFSDKMSRKRNNELAAGDKPANKKTPVGNTKPVCHYWNLLQTIRP